MIVRRATRFLALLGGLMAPSLAAQGLPSVDTTISYPWRLSYFPYITSSPNDGVMLMARAVLFRQSRWDDRTSIHDQIGFEGGYSTKNSWVVRARGDFPQLADGWRAQAIAEAARFDDYLPGSILGESATRQVIGGEVTRRLRGRVFVALRGEAVHINVPVDERALAISTGLPSQTDLRGRIALVYDGRDREYDTRKGLLLQGGVLACSFGSNCVGAYAIASGWLPIGEHTRVGGRTGFRKLKDGATGIDIARTVPGWEDEFVAGGGPESNRGMLTGERIANFSRFSSVEIRHDLKVFPGGAIALLAFVDGTSTTGDQFGDYFTHVVLGAGGGVAVRLLRNAVLTATVARGEQHTRVYVSSGWSW